MGHAHFAGAAEIVTPRATCGGQPAPPTETATVYATQQAASGRFNMVIMGASMATGSKNCGGKVACQGERQRPELTWGRRLEVSLRSALGCPVSLHVHAEGGWTSERAAHKLRNVLKEPSFQPDVVLLDASANDAAVSNWGHDVARRQYLLAAVESIVRRLDAQRIPAILVDLASWWGRFPPTCAWRRTPRARLDAWRGADDGARRALNATTSVYAAVADHWRLPYVSLLEASCGAAEQGGGDSIRHWRAGCESLDAAGMGCWVHPGPPRTTPLQRWLLTPLRPSPPAAPPDCCRLRPAARAQCNPNSRLRALRFARRAALRRLTSALGATWRGSSAKSNKLSPPVRLLRLGMTVGLHSWTGRQTWLDCRRLGRATRTSGKHRFQDPGQRTSGYAFLRVPAQLRPSDGPRSDMARALPLAWHCARWLVEVTGLTGRDGDYSAPQPAASLSEQLREDGPGLQRREGARAECAATARHGTGRRSSAPTPRQVQDYPGARL